MQDGEIMLKKLLMFGKPRKFSALLPHILSRGVQSSKIRLGSLIFLP